MKAHIVHTMLTLLLMSSSSAFCVFGLACISTTATTIHFFVYFFLFFVNSCICETAGWCCLFFYAHYSFFLYFFALVVYILSCEPSRAIFLYHSFFRAFFLQNMKTVFRYSIYIFFVLRSACSIPVLHLIHTVPCCVFYLCLCGSFPSFISLLLCFDAEISCAVFTDGVSWSRLRIILFFCLFVQQ